MEFLKEADRVAHPQAKFIPMPILKLFNFILTDLELDLMKLSWESILARKEEWMGYDAEARLRFWLCAVFSHPEMGEQALVDLATHLNLLPSQLFMGSVIAGKEDLLKHFKEEYLPTLVEELLTENNFWAFQMAVELGYPGIITQLFLWFPSKILDRLREDEYLLAAAGNIDVLKKLMDLAPDDKLAMIEANHFALFREAAARGDLLILQELVALIPDKLSEMLAAGEPFFIAPLPFLEYKEKDGEVVLMTPESESHYQALRMAVINGHEAVINYLLSFPEVMAYAERYHEYECWINKYKESVIEPSILTVDTSVAEPPSLSNTFDGPSSSHTPKFFSPRRAAVSNQQDNPAPQIGASA